ncbi:MAG TPA: NAD(P)/FAD-dependent oxidoreductase [Candidatus Korarchaeota archaeon]|nr:NAD(P)/FAD-dependent oxidoreductase [Candidatus Korarchaeota archaeon]
MRIIVYGAGPAGLSCAYWASKEGHSVVVYEKENELGTKPCGEAIPEEALLFTPLKEGDFICNRVKRCLFYVNWSFAREVSGFLSGYIIDKKKFLKELMEEAESEGAKVVLGSSPRPKDFDLLVDATGNPGSIARSFSFFDYSGYRSAPALQCYCSSKEALPDDAINLIILPYGYGWIFPKGEIYNVGVGGFIGTATLRKDLKTLFEKFDMNILGRVRRGIFSIGGPLKKIQGRGIVVVGEAAGMVMPFTGEGIRYALYSGSICYKPNYQRLWDERYGNRLRRGRRWLKKVLSLPADVRMKIIRDAPVELLVSLFQGERPRAKDLMFLLSSLVNSSVKGVSKRK